MIDRLRPQWTRLGLELRRQSMLPVVVVGLAGGAVGAAYLTVLHRLQELLGPSANAASATAVILVASGVAVTVGARWLGATGDVELLVDNIHVLGGAEHHEQPASMVPLSLLCVAAGGALGPEAPLVQTTGTLGSWVGRRLRLDRDGVRVLTITGMAAGFTVLFGAPIGGALFALEILHRRGLQYYEAIMPAVVGSLAGFAVAALTVHAGLEPVWRFEPFDRIGFGDLAWAAAAGVLGAVGATAFATLVRLTRRAFGVLPSWSRAVVGGAVLAVLGALSPYALTFGELQIDDIAAGRLTLAALAIALVAKLAGTTVSLAAGWKGGFIIPLFFLGATLGQMVHVLAPGADATVVMTALMVSWCVGVTKTPLGATLVVTEMAGVALLPTTLLAAAISLWCTSRVGLIESQRDRVHDGPDSVSSAPTPSAPPGSMPATGYGPGHDRRPQ